MGIVDIDGNFLLDIVEKLNANSLEILPSTLYWSPGLDTSLQVDSVTYVNALEIGHSNGKVAEYYVPHYHKYGVAFGPFPLDEILRFCRGLTLRLEDSMKIPLCLTTPPRNDQAYSNALVLVGAYLIFCQNWSATRVIGLFGAKDAERLFPRSWAKGGDPQTYLMRVRYCWEGLEAARKNNWIDLYCLHDDVLLDETCAKYRKMAFTYDAAWLVPDKVLLSSDPITTMCDPSAQTFGDLWEQQDDGCSTPSTVDSEEGTAYHSTPSTVDSEDGIAHRSTSTRRPSLQSVSKEYAFSHVFSDASANSIRHPSFRRFVQDCGVSLVIRTNFSDEQGMPQASYDENRWRTYDIEHIDLRFVDQNGAVPPSLVVANALSSYRKMMDANPGAVLIHCKSGFGRSVTLACCLVIHDYDVPGSALLGWARLCRPGSINTMEQEKYLLSLKGRSDVSSLLARANAENNCKPGAKISCGCVLQ